MSVGNVFGRVWRLKKEVTELRDLEENEQFRVLEEEGWHSPFSYITDLGYVNKLNFNLLGKNQSWAFEGIQDEFFFTFESDIEV
jgi:hypothetical protein